MSVNERIVCAANKYGEEIVLGIRHFDAIMGTHPRADGSYKARPVQGFITNRFRFVDRKEAYEIAVRENQILRYDVLNEDGLLTSENLY